MPAEQSLISRLPYFSYMTKIFWTRATLVFLALTLISPALFAQEKVAADKIIAVVGKSRIILESELDIQVEQQKQQDPNFTDSMRCNLLQQMMMQKMLVEQADRDSIFVGQEEVEAAIDNQVRYFVSKYGSKEQLERISGKSIYQMKEDARDQYENRMRADRVQASILSTVKVSPAQVRTFYSKIPVDSLPFFPATVEMGQIVVDPAVSPELDEYAREKLIGIRKQITDEGKSFEALAGLYSDDPGSRDNGGDLGTLKRTDVVPEFAAAAFRLQNGEISPIVKTKFGYHIIQMVSRQGEAAHMRHILVRAERSSADYKAALERLDSVRAQLIAGTIQFGAAVAKYSTTDESKMTGGMILDPENGSGQLEIEKLEPAMALMIDSLSPGSYSKPQIFVNPQGEKSCRIVYMKGRTEPHKANLVDDYARIQEVALGQQKTEALDTWMNAKMPTFYIRIAPEYKSCPELKRWESGEKM